MTCCCCDCTCESRFKKCPSLSDIWQEVTVHMEIVLDGPVTCMKQLCVSVLARKDMKGNLGKEKPRYASGRPKPVSRTVATSSGVNRIFHTLGIKYSPGSSVRTPCPLRDLKQISFAEPSTWSEQFSQRWLQQRGFFSKKTGHKFWICRRDMVKTTDPDVLRCSYSSCPGRQPRTLD